MSKSLFLMKDIFSIERLESFISEPIDRIPKLIYQYETTTTKNRKFSFFDLKVVTDIHNL